MADEQRLILFVGAGLFGLLLGSFLNVCIFRLPRQCMSIWKQTRSRCPKCRAFIAWYDNLPVVSWMALGGKCRGCRNPISMRYPAVELLTGGLVLWLAAGQLYPSSIAGALSGYGAQNGFDRGLLWSAQVFLAAALVVSTFIDFDFKILSDEISYGGLAAGLALCTVYPVLHLGGPLVLAYPFAEEAFELREKIWPLAASFAASALGAGAGSGATFFVRVVGEKLFGREAMGLGDVKLMAFLGAWLGWRAILLTFMLGCLFGSLYGILQYPFTRRMHDVEIWFGPFLALGAALFVFAGGGADETLAWIALRSRAWSEWLIQAGPAATIVALLVPFGLLTWMFYRVWKRGRGRDDPPSAG